MKSFLIALLPLILYFIPVCMGHCTVINNLFGLISHHVNASSVRTSKCWEIRVPENMHVQLHFKELNMTAGSDCNFVYLEISGIISGEKYTYCHENMTRSPPPITVYRDVSIYLSKQSYSYFNEFSLEYNIDRIRCTVIYNQFGLISHHLDASSPPTSKCWTIPVPQNTHVRLDINEISVTAQYDCIYASLAISVPDSNEKYTYCPEDMSIPSPITAFSDVIIYQYKHFITDYNKLSLEYHIERRVLYVKGVQASRENTGAWLLNNRQSSGWGRNTHRAITALFLAEVVSFREENLDEELMIKQLELQTLLALMRNSTDPLSVNELSMFVNALSVACHDPRRFYGQDLVKILSERVSIAESPSPGAYLALCSSNWTLTTSDIHSLLRLLYKPSPYPFILDVQAVAVMALTCVKNLEGKAFSRFHNASNIYNATVHKFIAGQHSDGSFGNVYTTALITQALIASEQENNIKWNMTSTVQYLMKKLNSSSVDFLAAYLALPVFSGKSLVNMAAANCANISKKQNEDIGFSDVTNKLGGKKRIQYSLYFGDQKDVINTIYMGVTDQSSAYDIMRVAQVANPLYKFRHRDVSGHMYVYEIAGLINDPEVGKFWLMHSENSDKIVEHHTESPDKFIIGNNGHLIMWYKTAHI